MIRFRPRCAAVAVSLIASLTPPAFAQSDQAEAVDAPANKVVQAAIKVAPLPQGDFVLRWEAGPIECEGRTIKPVAWVAPHPLFRNKNTDLFPVTIEFSIDETGHAFNITASEGGYVPGVMEVTLIPSENRVSVSAENLEQAGLIRDLMPSLRASQFEQGSTRNQCQITYTAQHSDSAGIPKELLARIGTVPQVRLAPYQRDQLGGADCNTQGWPAFLLQAVPDWRKITARMGARKWASLGFDIDDEGGPVNIAVIASSGHDDLDREAFSAIANSRFAAGPRTGCATTYWRDPAIISAPTAPQISDFSASGDCVVKAGWQTPPKLEFPQAYNQRNIDGWAILEFTASPDGKISDIEVLAAQPSEEFGTAAKIVLSTGTLNRRATDGGRCVTKVTFATPKRDKVEPAANSG